MEPRTKRKILVVYDVDGWAQHRHAEGLKRYSPDDLIVHTVPYGTYSQRTESWLRQYAAVYVISLYLAQRRKGVGRLVSNVASHAWMYERLNESNWRTFGVNKDRCYPVGMQRVRRLDAVICRNDKLGEWARRFHDCVSVIPAGVDRAIFTPGAFRNNTRQLRVGWCAQLGGITSFKGHEEILVPLRRTLPQYDWSVNTRMYEDAYSTERMVEWYRTLDAFVSTSSAEGTPNPPFEAASCGVPVISTDVGQVTDWDDLRELNMVVPDWGNEREAGKVVTQIADRLLKLEEPGIRQECRDRLLQSVADHYDYQTVAPETLEYVIADAVAPEPPNNVPPDEAAIVTDARRWDFVRRRLARKRRDAKDGRLWRFEPLRNYYGDTVDEAVDDAITDERR